ncbi:hypothetical protein JADG_010853 [Aureobasidium aubasidani]|nr:hypothetical protein JADG_010852 [Aureobasidium pullulans]KAG2171114.1 hypothetical protein JADG_010853 [Aureobasidium pullulans]
MCNCCHDVSGIEVFNGTYFYSCAIELVISLVKLIILEFADIEIIVSSFTGKQFLLGVYQRHIQSTYYELRFDQ